MLKRRNDLPNRYPINLLLPTAPSHIVLFYESSHGTFDKERFFLLGSKTSIMILTELMIRWVERGDHDDTPYI